MGTDPGAADVLAVLEDLGNALTDGLDDRTGVVVVEPGDVGTHDDDVRVGGRHAVERVIVGLAVAVALVQAGHLVVLVARDILRLGGLVVDGDLGHVHAGFQTGIGEQERTLDRLRGKLARDGVHVDLNVVRRDVLAVILAMEEIGVVALGALDEREDPAAALARIRMHLQRPAVHVDDEQAGVHDGVLPAVEDPRAVPDLTQGSHRDAAGTDRAGVARDVAHEQRESAGGAVRLDRHFKDDVRRRDAPVRQRFRVLVDIDADGAIATGPDLAGQRVDAVNNLVFTGNVHRDLAGGSDALGGQLQVIGFLRNGKAGHAKGKNQRSHHDPLDRAMQNKHLHTC